MNVNSRHFVFSDHLLNSHGLGACQNQLKISFSEFTFSVMIMKCSQTARSLSSALKACASRCMRPRCKLTRYFHVHFDDTSNVIGLTVVLVGYISQCKFYNQILLKCFHMISQCNKLCGKIKEDHKRFFLRLLAYELFLCSFFFQKVAQFMS